MTQALFDFHAGDRPLLISVPHAGTEVPNEISERFTEAGKLIADTDWHVPRLYEAARDKGASILVARKSRYVVDLNRRSDGRALYGGADNTEICPLTTFDREAIYRPGEEPDAREVAARIALYWKPYHDKLAEELERLRERHHKVLLWDAHSIRSEVPRFFEGRLPDLNFGTAGGASADSELLEAVTAEAEDQCRKSGHSWVANGRFKGGAITRGYGNPAGEIHAIQLELSQATYMDEAAPFSFLDEKATRIKPVIASLLDRALEWIEK